MNVPSRKRPPSFQCAACGSWRSIVVDTRPSVAGVARRRKCLGCGVRFTTEETPKRYVQRIIIRKHKARA